MAEFCKQCSIELFGIDTKDLAGRGELEVGYGWPALCEDCGCILVNNLGECETCELKKGHFGHDGDKNFAREHSS